MCAGTDMMARLIGQNLSDEVGVPAVVDDTHRASTIIGAQDVYKSTPDGHTRVHTMVITHTQNPHLFAKLRYDPFKHFTALSPVARSTTVLITNKHAPFNDFKGMIAYVKANPGKLTVASCSPGSTAHINAEMLRVTARDCRNHKKPRQRAHGHDRQTVSSGSYTLTTNAGAL